MILLDTDHLTVHAFPDSLDQPQLEQQSLFHGESPC